MQVLEISVIHTGIPIDRHHVSTPKPLFPLKVQIDFETIMKLKLKCIFY